MSLSVYSSSAGSGKTTTLVNAYLTIALKKPEDFRHILAITFTNKAANEMKERVIKVLKILNKDENYPDNLHELVQNVNLDNPKLRERAGLLLSLILHNYDDFSISTIDSFIHRIIRTFATDIKIPQNFEVVIDESDIIPDIISRLYEKVGHDHDLTSLLVGFVMSESEDEKSYDPTSKLIEFIKTQIREDGFMEVKKLDNLSISELSDIIARIQSKKREYRKIVIDTANKILGLCKSIQIDPSDFKGGKSRGFLTYIIKVSKFGSDSASLLASDAMKTIVENNDWYAKTLAIDKKDSIDGISGQLTEEFYIIQTYLKKHLYLNLVYSKIYSLALISEIRRLFSEYTNETGKVHISEFNKKISDQISDQSIPYIYERLGRKYKHFLIDEFQDTSVLQWQNLLPLIDESLSNGNFNLLVGDAKQAIYRFRNGEVELFASLPKIYKNDNSQVSIERENNLIRNYEPKSLLTNWRSYHEIIKFNNSFFRVIVEDTTQRTSGIYGDLEQKTPNNDKAGGLVSIRFAITEIEESVNAKNKEIEVIINELISKGYNPEQICILCRTRRRATEIATHLLEKDIEVVSSESLLLNNSPGVRLIIGFLKLLKNIKDDIALAEFVDNYIRYSNPQLIFNEEISKIRKSKLSGVSDLLDRYHMSFDIDEIEILSVFEICELLYRNLRISDEPDVFIQYFLDFAFENNYELDDFLSIWEEKHKGLFISMPENLKAVKIMTIHKSKGLDFPVVIVDAEIKKVENTKSEYWEQLEIEGLEKLNVAMLPIKNQLKLIGKENILLEETSKTELDYINLLYVAFTRPVYALYAICEGGETKDMFSKYMLKYLERMDLWEPEKLSYDMGSLPVPFKPESKSKSLSLDRFVSSRWYDLISIARSPELLPHIIEGKSSREYGNLIHGILSEIRVIDDIEPVLQKIKQTGMMNDSKIEIIKEIIINITKNTELAELFNKKNIIRNETEILLDSGEIIRPDRVVVHDDQVTIIDYKTGDEKERDIDQVEGYKLAFNKMGYKNINVKLVYLSDQIKIVNIN